MISFPALRLALLAGVLGFSLHARADSAASSASSAGSASSGSVSDSLSGSSNSSRGDRKVADGNYRIIDIARTPDRDGMARVTMLADGDGSADTPVDHIVLDLPQTTFDRQRLARGDVVHARNRVYGIEFAHAGTDAGAPRSPFYLVLDDAWYGELASRPVTL